MTLKEGGLRGSLRNVGVGVADIPDSVVTSPESNDLDNFSGDTGDISITSTAPTSDDTGLSYKFDVGGTGIEILSASGLNAYPSRDQRFSQRLFVDDESDPAFFNIGFNAVDFNNYFGGEVRYDNDNITLFKFDGGSFTSLDSTAYAAPINESLYQVIEWQSNDTVVYEVYEESQDPENDTPAASVNASISPFTTDGSLASGIVIRGRRPNSSTAAVYDYWIRQDGL